MHDNLNTITLSFREELEYVTAKGNNVTKIVWTKISNLTAINMNSGTRELTLKCKL